MAYVKKYFISRFLDGYLLEADYSQLEVIGLAYLSDDKVLKKDIIDGVDMHCMSTSFLTGEKYEVIKEAVASGDEYWTKKRKAAKSVSFAQQYGAGATSIARDNNLEKEVVQQFIDNYYDRYRGVKAFQERVSEEVHQSRVPSKLRTSNHYPAGIGKFQSISGRVYTFREYDAPDFMDAKVSFSPTQLKNYPVQGFATGDIVPMMLGKLLRTLKADDQLRDSCLMINTIHDSVMFDCDKHTVEYAGKRIKETMEDAPKYFYEIFGKVFDLPLKVDVEYGSSWDDMKSLFN